MTLRASLIRTTGRARLEHDDVLQGRGEMADPDGPTSAQRFSSSQPTPFSRFQQTLMTPLCSQ
jgi:hypothetical protein